MRMHRRTPQIACAAVAAVAICGLGGAARAATITMNANDGFGQASFDSALHWVGGAAPSAGNSYDTGGYLLRTPVAGAPASPFQGDSLTVQGPVGYDLATGDLNNAFMFKSNVGGYAVTVNNMTVNRAFIRHGQGDADTFTLNGDLTIGSDGAGFHVQGGLNVAAQVKGSGTVVIRANGSASTSRVVTFSSSLNTFNGSIHLLDAAQSRFALADNGVLNFVIGASGVNNSIYGSGVAALNGDFNLDLAGAGTTVGDTWQLAGVTAGSVTYGSTFTVVGFAEDAGGALWTKSINTAKAYQFDEATGAMSVIAVPEPASLGLLSAGAVLMLRRRRA